MEKESRKIRKNFEHIFFVSIQSSYVLRFLINGREVWSRINNNAEDYRNVDVYASNPFLVTANAMVRDFKYEQLTAQGKAKTEKRNICKSRNLEMGKLLTKLITFELDFAYHHTIVSFREFSNLVKRILQILWRIWCDHMTKYFWITLYLKLKSF